MIVMKIKRRIHNNFIKYLHKLLHEQKELIQEMLIEPYGTIRYEILKLHLAILDLKINLLKEIREVIN